MTSFRRPNSVVFSPRLISESVAHPQKLKNQQRLKNPILSFRYSCRVLFTVTGYLCRNLWSLQFNTGAPEEDEIEAIARHPRRVQEPLKGKNINQQSQSSGWCGSSHPVSGCALGTPTTSMDSTRLVRAGTRTCTTSQTPPNRRQLFRIYTR